MLSTVGDDAILESIVVAEVEVVLGDIVGVVAVVAVAVAVGVRCMDNGGGGMGEEFSMMVSGVGFCIVGDRDNRATDSETGYLGVEVIR